jgi:hypothetical protein
MFGYPERIAGRRRYVTSFIGVGRFELAYYVLDADRSRPRRSKGTPGVYSRLWLCGLGRYGLVLDRRV